MENKQETVDVPKDDDKAKKEALARVMDAFKKFKDGDLSIPDMSYEDKVNLEVDFRIAGTLVPEDDFDLTEFRKKNMISVGL